MSWKSSMTDRAEDALKRARIELKRRPMALASTELARGIGECGPSLARRVLTALDLNVCDVLERAALVASARGTELPLRRFQIRPATRPWLLMSWTDDDLPRPRASVA
jgi:hypothetical protein